MDAAQDTSRISGDIPDGQSGEAPLELRNALRDGETIIWWRRGSGSTLETRDIFAFTVVVMFAIISIVHWVYMRDLIVVGLAAALLILTGAPIIAKTTLGARWEIYALTPDRLIFMRNIFPGYSVSFARYGSPDDAAPPSSALLRATGTTPNGAVFLRGDFTLHGKSGADAHRTGLVRLTGVDRPLEVAQLIKTTLNLPFPIEDKTQ